MGLKKKLATTFTRKSNSRKEKRKEAAKREKALKGSNFSLTASQIFEELHEEYENSKKSIPESETRLPVANNNNKLFQETPEASEIQMLPSHVVSHNKKQPGDVNRRFRLSN